MRKSFKSVPVSFKHANLVVRNLLRCYYTHTNTLLSDQRHSNKMISLTSSSAFRRCQDGDRSVGGTVLLSTDPKPNNSSRVPSTTCCAVELSSPPFRFLHLLPPVNYYPPHIVFHVLNHPPFRRFYLITKTSGSLHHRIVRFINLSVSCKFTYMTVPKTPLLLCFDVLS